MCHVGIQEIDMLHKIVSKECPFGIYLKAKLYEWGYAGRRGDLMAMTAEINKKAGFTVLSGRSDIYGWFKKGPSLQHSGYLSSNRHEQVFTNLFGEEADKVLCLCPLSTHDSVTTATLQTVLLIPDITRVCVEHLPFVQMDLEIRRHWGDKFGFHTNIFDLIKVESVTWADTRE